MRVVIVVQLRVVTGGHHVARAKRRKRGAQTKTKKKKNSFEFEVLPSHLTACSSVVLGSMLALVGL